MERDEGGERGRRERKEREEGERGRRERKEDGAAGGEDMRAFELVLFEYISEWISLHTSYTSSKCTLVFLLQGT